MTEYIKYLEFLMKYYRTYDLVYNTFLDPNRNYNNSIRELDCYEDNLRDTIISLSLWQIAYCRVSEKYADDLGFDIYADKEFQNLVKQKLGVKLRQ